MNRNIFAIHIEIFFEDLSTRNVTKLTHSHAVTTFASKLNFFLTQVTCSMVTNGSIHMDTCVSDFYCDKDLNGEVIC